MLPLHLAQKLPKPVSFQPEDSGAVVFGYNSEFPWIWSDTGDPDMGQQPLSDDDSDAEAEDSGIGSSIFSSTQSKTRRRHQSSDSNNDFPAHEDYRIGIICALPRELMAVHGLLDEEYPKLPLEESDTNSAYVLGQMEGHNVVIVALPDGDHGTNSAATVATDMNRSFRALRFYFVVGISGGVPSKAHDIRLGDDHGSRHALDPARF